MNLSMHQDDQIFIIRISGRIDIESAQKFRAQSFSQLGQHRIVFDCTDLVFVGSTGISLLLETFAHLVQEHADSVRICGLGFEFSQVLCSLVPGLYIYQSVNEAKAAFSSSNYSGDDSSAFTLLENPD